MLVSSIGDIGTAAIDSELSEMGMDSLVISASELNENDLQAVKAVSNVSDAMPLMNKVTTVSMRNKTISAMVWGVNEDADKVVNLEIKYGRLLNRGDIAQKNHVCVIDEAIANISVSKNMRNREKCFDTVKDYGSGNWIYEFNSIAQRRVTAAHACEEKQDLEGAGHNYRI